MIDLDSNIVQKGKDKLITQYYRSENIEKVLEIGLDLLQDAETIAHSLYTNRTIENAVGRQLDDVGAIVGQARNGLSDEIYRLRIKAKIAENNSEGTREEIINIAKLLTNAERVIITERKADFDVTFYNITNPIASWDEVKQAIKNATCSGIGVTVEESQYKIFRFLDRDGNIPIDGGGFRDLFNLRRPTNPFIFDTVGQGFDEGELSEITAHDTGNVINPNAGHLVTIK
jgi:hypothetical protein